MIRMKIVAATTALSVLVGAASIPAHAQSNDLFSNENIGTVLGGVGGAVIGGQFGSGKGKLVGVAAGTLLGAYLGRQVGASLTPKDQSYANKSAGQAFESTPTGRSVAWQNPDSGNSGTITPTRTYQSNGSYCREYTQSIVVGGKTETANGTACRQPDGSWKIVN